MLWACVVDPTQFSETVETQPELVNDGQGDCTDDTAECDPQGKTMLERTNKRGITTQTSVFVGAETPNQHRSSKLVEYAKVLTFQIVPVS